MKMAKDKILFAVVFFLMVGTFFVNNIHQYVTHEQYVTPYGDTVYKANGKPLQTNVVIHKIAKKVNIIIYSICAIMMGFVRDIRYQLASGAVMAFNVLITLFNIYVVIYNGMKYDYFAEGMAMLVMFAFIAVVYFIKKKKKI